MKLFLSNHATVWTGWETKEDGKPCVTSDKHDNNLFEITFRQTSLSFKQIFFVKTRKH